jgi:hypothetical protein
MDINNSASAALRAISLSASSIGTRSVSIGANRLPAGSRATRQHVSNAEITRVEYNGRRALRGLTTRTVPASRIRVRAWSRCQPVNSHNSSRILDFSDLEPRRYAVAILLVTADRSPIESSIDQA